MNDARFSLMRDNHTQVSHIAGDLSMNTSPWNKNRIIVQKTLTISHIWGRSVNMDVVLIDDNNPYSISHLKTLRSHD